MKEEPPVQEKKTAKQAIVEVLKYIKQEKEKQARIENDKREAILRKKFNDKERQMKIALNSAVNNDSHFNHIVEYSHVLLQSKIDPYYKVR